MTTTPALIARHDRPILFVAVLLAGMLAITAVAVSIWLYQAQAGAGAVLAPQLLTLLAAGIARKACARWAETAPCLTISAEGLTVPGHAVRPIPWTAVRAARITTCALTPDDTAPRHYLAAVVDQPESFGIRARGPLSRLLAPQPNGGPLLTVDISELDTGKEAILGAMRHFHPDAVDGALPTLAPHDSHGAVWRPVVTGVHAKACALQSRGGQAWSRAVRVLRDLPLHLSAKCGALIARGRAASGIVLSRLRHGAGQASGAAGAGVRRRVGAGRDRGQRATRLLSYKFLFTGTISRPPL